MLEQRLEAFDVVMTLEGLALPLSKKSQNVFETITRDSISRSIVEVLGSDQIHSLEVDVSLSLPPIRRLIRTRNNRLRRMEKVSLSFDVLIMIRSVIKVHDLNRYIVGAFNDFLDKFIFVNALKASGDPTFADISSVSVTPGSIGEGRPSEPGDTDGSNENTHDSNRPLIEMIVSASIAFVAFIGLAVFFVEHYRQKKQKGQRINQNETFSSSLFLGIVLQPDIASEIEIGSYTDVSSLDDPSLISLSGREVLEAHDLVFDCDDGGDACIGQDHRSLLPLAIQYELLPSAGTLPRDSHSAPVLSRNTSFLSLDDAINCGSRSVPASANDYESNDYARIACIGQGTVPCDSHSVPLPSRDNSFLSLDDALNCGSRSVPPSAIDYESNDCARIACIGQGTVPCDSHSAPLPSRDNSFLSLDDALNCGSRSVPPSAIDYESNDCARIACVGQGTVPCDSHSAPLPSRDNSFLSLDDALNCGSRSVPPSAFNYESNDYEMISCLDQDDKSLPLADTVPCDSHSAPLLSRDNSFLSLDEAISTAIQGQFLHQLKMTFCWLMVFIRLLVSPVPRR